MKTRAVDENHDWIFGKGKNSYKKDQKALAQNIKCRLLMFLGDCFFSLSSGIDWFNLIGSKRITELKLNIATMILNTEGVTEITSLHVAQDEKRNFTITFSVNTIYGEIYQTIGAPVA